MAYEENVRSISLPAAAVFVAADIGKAIKVDANGRAAVAAAGEFAIGVLSSRSAAIGDAVEVAVDGIVKVRTAGTVTVGALLTCNASGTFVAATLGRTNTSDAGAAVDPLIGSNVLGVALEVGGTLALASMVWRQAGASPTTVA